MVVNYVNTNQICSIDVVVELLVEGIYLAFFKLDFWSLSRLLVSFFMVRFAFA